MKLICPECGSRYDSGKFCQECGATLKEVVPELVCPSCGYKAQSGKFCPECGTKLAEQITEEDSAKHEEIAERKFNEKDERFAKYYDRNGFPREIPQEERAIAIEELTPFADQNIAEAKMLLGAILMRDSNKEMVIKGAKLLKEAEQSGDKIAYYVMGVGYFEGWESIVEINHEEAEKRFLELYKEFKDGGSAGMLAELYALSTEKCDYKKAFEYATIAADDDEESGYKVLGDLYFNGLGVEKNTQLALENYKMAAAYGDEEAMNQIGFIFMGNDGVEANPEQSFYWFNESSKKSSNVGLYYLGWCYKEGFGIKEDIEKAAEYFKQSAELGYPDAMCELGWYYQNILFDIDKSKMWYRKAAELGYAEAQNKLAVLYTDDLEPDYNEAVTWLQKAMEQDEPWAFRNYAWLLWNGNGIEENRDKAKEMMQKAISLGLPDAEKELKEMEEALVGGDKTIENVTKSPAANEWFVPEGTTMLDNSVLPDTSCKWRESIEIIHLPESLKSEELYIEEDELYDFCIFPNLKKVIIPTGQLERFCEISEWIEYNWYDVWNDDGTHVCPDILPIIEKSNDSFDFSQYSERIVNKAYCSTDAFIFSPNCQEIGNEAFSFNKKVKSVYMCDSVLVIGKEAFRGCHNLEEIRLSNNIKTIHKKTFGNCDKLKELIIPEGVTEIEEAAFVACKSLESITLPSTIRKIDSGGTWGFNPFQLCNSLREIIVPKGTLSHFQQLLKGFSGNPAQYLVEV